MATKVQIQNRRITISKVYIVALIILFLLASIKWIRSYTDPDPRPEPDTLDNVSGAAEALLLPAFFFGVGLLMFTSGIFASLGVVFMVVSALLFGYALYKVITAVKQAAIDFIDPINPFT